MQIHGLFDCRFAFQGGERERPPMPAIGLRILHILETQAAYVAGHGMLTADNPDDGCIVCGLAMAGPNFKCMFCQYDFHVSCLP